jgi:hypothetical protein
MWFVGAPAGWKISVRLGGSMSLTRRAALAGGGLAMLTGLPAVSQPGVAQAFIKTEVDRWAAIVKNSGAEPE